MFTKVWNDLVFFHLSLQIHDPLLFGSSPRSQALWTSPHFFLTQLSSVYGNQQCSQKGEVIIPGLYSWILHWRIAINCPCPQTKDYCLPQGISWYAALLSFLNSQECWQWYLQSGKGTVPAFVIFLCTCLCHYFLYDNFLGCPVCRDCDKHIAHGLDSYQIRLSIWLHPRLKGMLYIVCFSRVCIMCKY